MSCYLVAPSFKNWSGLVVCVYLVSQSFCACMICFTKGKDSKFTQRHFGKIVKSSILKKGSFLCCHGGGEIPWGTGEEFLEVCVTEKL